MSVLPYYSNSILSIMQKQGNLTESDYNQVQDLLSQAIRNPRNDLQSVFIYRRDGQIFSSSIYNADINYQYNFRGSSWYRQAIAANGRVVFSGKVHDLRIINRPQPAFSLYRAIKIYNGPILGVIIIDVNFSGLENIFKNVDLGKYSNVVVVDSNKNVIYSQNNNYINSLSQIDLSKNKIQDINLKNNTLIVNHIKSPITGWDIVGIVSKAEVNHEKDVLYKTIFMISAIIFLTVIFVSALLSNTITKPLRKLRRLMRQVEEGNFDVSYESLGGNVEISLVGRAFNRMNMKINELINQVIEIRVKQNEAELNNLKLQIRPHFLFNNLEAVRALAEIGDREGIVEITAALGGMLRYSLNKQNSQVRLRDEINQIQNYLTIEQIRSGHALHVVFDLDENLLDCFTIPILLLPVVENCIHHGFRYEQSDKEIQVSVKSYSDGILITIQDNGIGIRPDELVELNAYLSDQVDELTFGNFGIGIKNLATRIQLEYGTNYGISLSSRHGEGMTVEVRIPRIGS